MKEIFDIFIEIQNLTFLFLPRPQKPTLNKMNTKSEKKIFFENRVVLTMVGARFTSDPDLSFFYFVKYFFLYFDK
jgi:hypothetical protein